MFTVLDAAPSRSRSVAYLLGGVPLALAWLLVAAAGLLAGGATLVIGLGLPLLLGVLMLTRTCADLDRRLIGRVLGVEVARPATEPAADSWPAAARALLGDARTWRSMGWMLFRAVSSSLVLIGALVSAVVLGALLVVPFRTGYLQWGDTWRSPSGWATAWTPLAGAAGLFVLLSVARLVAGVHLRVALVLLAPDPGVELARAAGRVRRAQERMTLARDLHDSIGHAMTLVAVQAAAAASAFERDRDFARRALDDIADAARRALDELDAALAALRDYDVPAARTGTLADLPALLTRARHAGMLVDLPEAEALIDPAISDAVSEAGYRVIQEACTNVLKHAGLTAPATVSLTLDVHAIRICVRSPMAGHASLERSGAGLAGARQRVRRLGGTLGAGPDGQGQWRVDAVIPLQDVRSGAPAQPGDQA